MKEMITVEKEVYEAVLRNSVRVIDLEAENAQLIKFLEEFNALDVAKENQRLQMSLRMTVDDYKNVVDICEQLKELLNYIRDEIADMPATALQLGYGWISEAAYRIDNAIGEKK